MQELEKYRDILLEKKAFAQVGITRKNGKPHVSPLWFDMTEDDYQNGIININTAQGRVKANHIAKGDTIAISILDPDNPYRYLGLEGEVLDTITGPVAEDHIDGLMFKYQGKRPYAYRKEGEVRIKISIQIINVHKR